MRKRWIVFGVIVAAVVVGYASGFFHSFAVAFVEGRRSVVEGHWGLPSCDTETGLGNAKGAINNIPTLKQLGITALGINNANAGSTTDSKIECEGVVTLSNGMRGPVYYSFAKDTSVDAPFLVRAREMLTS
jgi:hypothetical protein